MFTEDSKSLVRATLRKSRKAKCWLTRHGHRAYSQDSKKVRKRIYKYFNEAVSTQRYCDLIQIN